MHDPSNTAYVSEGLRGVVTARRRRTVEPHRASNRNAGGEAPTVERVAAFGDCYGVPRHVDSLYVASLHISPGVCDAGWMPATMLLRNAATNSGLDTDLDRELSTITERPWNVVVWNDPVTPMTVVVAVFKRIFGYSNNKCTHLMLTVHHEGRAIVWSGQRARAESYCVKLQVAGLQSTVEKDA